MPPVMAMVTAAAGDFKSCGAGVCPFLLRAKRGCVWGRVSVAT